MSNMILYIGNEHVILEPKFDFMQDYLLAEANRDAGARKACQRNHTGVLNTYRLDFRTLKVVQEFGNMETTDADVVISGNSNDSFVRIQTEKALKQLTFLGASFVSADNH